MIVREGRAARSAMWEAMALRQRRVKVLSLGGGLDSFAMLVEGLRRGDRPDIVVFINVGDSKGEDPGEWEGTYRHIREVVAPLCEREGIELVIIDERTYPVRDARSLFAWLWARKSIPVAGPTRICTRIAKTERFEAWMHDRFPDREVEVWIGFEAGEESRVDKDPNVGTAGSAGPGKATRINRFPLIEWGLCRCRCERLVRDAGYPVPRKSACKGCPYGTRGDWQRFAVEDPAGFGKFVALEREKPLTKRGLKLTIMAYSSKTQSGEMLPLYVSKPYRPKIIPCKVCGAKQRATKAVGCDYLEDNEARQAA